MSLYRHPPYAHQLKALELCRDKKAFAFFMEMGTGKSKVVIDDAARLFRAGCIDGLFIVANKGSYMNWVTKEIGDHLPDNIQRTIRYWDGRIKEYGPPAFSEESLDIFVMNVEALAFPRSYEEAQHFIKSTKCMVVADESTAIKTQEAKRTKAAVKLGKLGLFRRILTGSPITKNPLDLYSQCQFLENGILGFTSYYAFRARYADLFTMDAGNRSFKVVKGYKNLEELTGKLSEFSYRVLKEDCLDLPPKTYSKISVELTVEQARIYAQLKAEAMAEFSGGVTFAPLAITRLLRMHQVVCGHLPNEEGKSTPIANNRLRALETVLAETSGKVVIWATYTADIEAIVNMLICAYKDEEGIVRYDGTTNAEDRAAGVKAFQEDPKIRFFVGNPKAGGYGITLHAASTMVYYSNNYDLETRLQSEDRIHRIGQVSPCTYIDLVSALTVDEAIINALRNKKNLAGEVLGDRWKEWIK